MSVVVSGDVVGPYRAAVLTIPGEGDVPSIVDGNGHYVGFLTECSNAELAEAFGRSPMLVGLWPWRDIPEDSQERGTR